MLAKFSKGDTGTYAVVGTRGTVNGIDGIIVDSIVPAADSPARPSPTATPPAAAQTAAAPTSRVVTAGIRQYDTYDYTESVARGVIKNYRLAIPKGLTTVKGILVVSNCFGGDTRDWYKGGTAYEEFLHLHDFAFVSGTLDPSHYEAYDAFVKALVVWSNTSGHPELVNVPYVTTGLSAGGGFASTLVTKCPEKVIAAVIVCARLNLTVFELPKYDPKNPVPVPAAVIGTPVLNITGETEYSAPVIEPPMETYRPVGALYGWAESPGFGHEYCGQEVLAMPYLEAAVGLRYPSTGAARKAPLKLKPLDPKSGWVVDHATWKSGLTSIIPSGQFQGDIRKSSWLPDKNVAFIYRAYATYNRRLKITSPAQNNIHTPVQSPGSSITIQVDASTFPGWKKRSMMAPSCSAASPRA
jgi:hypothetical protein